MNNYKLSVITVCYNAAKTIEKTIMSVINQSYNNIECIVVDGASTDGTLSILDKYQNKIKYISKVDNGIYDAMNKGLRIATGDFVLFLGADDTLADYDSISNVFKNIDSDDAVYYGNVIYSDTGKIYDGKFNSWKLSVKNICHQSVFYPKEIYKKYNYSDKYLLVADWYYNLTLYKDKIKFKYLPVIVALYNRSGQSSGNKDNFFLDERFSIIKDTLGVSHCFYCVMYKFTFNIFCKKK